MTMRIKKYHDCESIRPAMVVGLKKRTVASGIWPFRKTEIVLDKVYASVEAEWTCPECNSEWNYRPSFSSLEKGMWMAKKRIYRWVKSDVRNFEQG